MQMKKILILTIAIFLLVFPVSAQEISMKNNVPYNKIWTIKFTHDLEWKSIKTGIIVTDSKGIKQDIRAALGDEPNTLVVLPPQGGYKPLETYTMIINQNIKNKNGKSLRENTTFRFTTNNEKPPKTETYDTTFAEVDIKAYYNNKMISDKKGIVVDNKVITTYSAIDGADSAVITTKYGIQCEVDGVCWYDKNKNIAVLKINPTNVLSANSERIGKISIENISIDYEELVEILNKYKYEKLIQVRKENHYSMNLDELENYMWKKYSNYKIDSYSLSFDNILVLNDKKDNNAIDIYFVMNEKQFGELWDFVFMNLSDYREKIESMLNYAYNDAANQFPDKMINIRIMCNYVSSSNIANFDGDDVFYNENSKTWDIKADIVYFTKIQGNKYSKWNEVF